MPTKEEINLFRLGGHNAEALAAMTLAKRLGIEVSKARTMLTRAVAP